MNPVPTPSKTNRHLPPRVFFLSDFWYPRLGGLERSIHYLLDALHPKIEVELITTGRPSGPEVPLARVRRFPSTSTRSFYSAAFDSIACDAGPRPLVHIFGFSFSWPEQHAALIIKLARELDARIILKVPTLGDADRSLKSEYRGARDHIAAFIALNPDIAEELAGCGVDKDRILSIPNGVPLAEYSPCTPEERTRARQEYGLPADRPLIGFAGRFVTRKRLDLVIEALRRVEPSRRPVLVLIGHVDATFGDAFDPGPYLDEHLYWLPAQRDIRTFFQAIDAYVSASEAEGMPNSVLEAMACGLPVLASKIPGQRELVIHGNNGWLFEPGDVQGLCGCLEVFFRVWSSGDLESLGKRSRQLVDARHGSHVVASRYIELYQSLFCTGKRR